MRKFYLIVLLILFVACNPTGGESNENQGITFEGKLVDEDTSEPIANVNVILESYFADGNPYTKTTSNSNGEFTLSIDPSMEGDFQIYFHKDLTYAKSYDEDKFNESSKNVVSMKRKVFKECYSVPIGTGVWDLHYVKENNRYLVVGPSNDEIVKLDDGFEFVSELNIDIGDTRNSVLSITYDGNSYWILFDDGYDSFKPNDDYDRYIAKVNPANGELESFQGIDDALKFVQISYGDNSLWALDEQYNNGRFIYTIHEIEPETGRFLSNHTKNFGLKVFDMKYLGNDSFWFSLVDRNWYNDDINTIEPSLIKYNINTGIETNFTIDKSQLEAYQTLDIGKSLREYLINELGYGLPYFSEKYSSIPRSIIPNNDELWVLFSKDYTGYFCQLNIE